MKFEEGYVTLREFEKTPETQSRFAVISESIVSALPLILKGAVAPIKRICTKSSKPEPTDHQPVETAPEPKSSGKIMAKIPWFPLILTANTIISTGLLYRRYKGFWKHDK